MLDRYRYVLRSRMDITIMLLVFFLAFYSRGYYQLASYVLYPLTFFTVNALFRLRRM